MSLPIHVVQTSEHPVKTLRWISDGPVLNLEFRTSC